MSTLSVPSMGAAMKAGLDSLVIDERQYAPPFRDVLRMCGYIMLAMLAVLVVLPALYFFLGLFTAVGLTAAVLFVPTHRVVCLVAHPDYFVAIRSEKARYGATPEWDLDSMPGRVIAVLEKSPDLRPEERPSPGLPAGIDTYIPIRDVFVFENGQVNVLIRARANEDQSISTLHRVKAFFERNSMPPPIRTSPSEEARQLPISGKVRRKGTAG